MNMMAQLRLLVHLSFRSLWSHKTKNLIVGSIISFGAILVVLGSALLDSIEGSMSRSVIHSLAGHLQIYSNQAKDQLSVYGGTTAGYSDYGEIENFAKLKAQIEKHENVEALVPMGIQVATMTRGSDLEHTLTEMREAHHDGKLARFNTLIPRAQRLISLLATDLENRARVSSKARQAELDGALADIAGTKEEDFWNELRKRPLQQLEFLDTKIAPWAGEGRLMYLRYVGTDMASFAKHFDRFRIAKGEMVPEGQRGLLINQKYADRRLKIMAARLFDALELARQDGVQIAGNAALEAKARRLATQAGALAIKLGPAEADMIESSLGKLFPKVVGLDALLEKLLTVSDDTFQNHYRYFYDELAPVISLYPFKVGDVLTIRSMTKRGYFKTANIKVYGTFNFEGLERSELSGAANLVDLMTFRDLYGQMSEAESEELQAIRKGAGARIIQRDSAEDALFGRPEDVIEEATVEAQGFSEFDGVDLQRPKRTSASALPFTQFQMENGLIINAAVMLKDPSKLKRTMEDLQASLDQAGMDLKVIDWRSASGMLGQIAILVRVILYVAIVIIFAVALVIINNSMLMATLERIREIGTLRAMGAQRSFVMGMCLFETVILGLLAGSAGALLGAGIMSWLGNYGIPANNDILIFLFSGTRLYPTFESHHLLLSMFVVLTVSILSTYYPARIATQIQPVEAMQSRD